MSVRRNVRISGEQVGLRGGDEKISKENARVVPPPFSRSVADL